MRREWVSWLASLIINETFSGNSENHSFTAAVSGFEDNLEAAVLYIGLTNALMRFIICAEYQF